MPEPKRFSEAQFVALAETMRLSPKSASCKALRRVLVDGQSPQMAAIAERYYEHHIERTLESAKRCIQRAQLLHGLQLPET